MQKIRIEPYKTWSGGAKRLGKRAGILRATKRQVAKHGDFDVIINWGRSERRFNGQYINDPAKVDIAGNKLTAFEQLKNGGVPVPAFTCDKSRAQAWLESGGYVVARKLLRGSAGRGIVLVGPANSEIPCVQQLPDAPLYVQYVKKATEFRIHVFDGEVIDEQQKKRNLDVPDENVNWQIRNHDRGWVFARNDITVPDCVREAAVASVAALGLDFGAVDIGYNEHSGTCVVYEVNTAPGLEGSTVDRYFTAIANRLPAITSGRYALRRQAA